MLVYLFIFYINYSLDICDPLSRKCEYYQGKESTVSTFMVHWTCDGENDCGNGFDESNCEGKQINNLKLKYTFIINLVIMYWNILDRL